ncbi:hypothetical protein D9756_003526 [Leucocoprinus leucothites]|uniref:BHLH domain-containing protein n=1 Tax=Leucocoprinus leucothites TaxID=201217 RepID=A0A8H5LJB1_9AGAR|nr:hypothetical protein D9756_003526 [Leucoagaricus leucothites]
MLSHLPAPPPLPVPFPALQPALYRLYNMDLLSPAESHAFQSFLSAMDYADLSPSEWALLNSTNVVSDDEIIGHGHSSELLAKATKDLMALDTGRWDSLAQQPNGLYSHQSQQQQHQTYPNAYSHRQTPYSRRETFPFLNSKAQVQQSMLSIPPHHTDLHTHLVSPTATSAPTSATTTPATPQSPFGFSDLPSHSISHLHLAQTQLNQSHLQHQRPTSPSTKRTSSGTASGSSKRLRPSPPVASSSSVNSAASGPTKQSLLSPSQKKANHIQSEQKRRANIRRGYEALCDTVPTLREAIREEEEAEARMSMGLGSSGKPSRSKRKKKDTAGGDGEKEKIDGRAGPRSENVVLSKTIEYINELLSDRTSLLARLERARSSLPKDHPTLASLSIGERLWEREWKGGSGRLDGEAGEDEDEDGDSP